MSQIERQRFRILSLDGGGIKGTFSASFLANLEDSLGLESAAQHFDLIAGTSTGGIIAIGLGLGFSAREMLRFYEDNGPKIFGARGTVAAILHQCLGSGKHPAEPLRSALMRTFGTKRLGDSKNRLLIPAFDANRGGIHIFKTAHHPRLITDYRVPVVDVALSTSAAPTFLPAHSGPVLAVDGGLWANNPAALAVVEAVGMLSQERGDIDLLSVGCTDCPLPRVPRRLPGPFWLKSVLEFVMCGQAFAAIGMSQHLLGHASVFRYSPTVDRGRFDLDDSRTIAQLKELGYSHSREASRELAPRFFTSKAAVFVPFH